MNTLKAGGTATFMRRKGASSGSEAASIYTVGVINNLIGRMAYVPTEARKRWTLWRWDTGGPFMLVDPGATGATTIHPHVLPHVTWYQSTTSSLPADLESTFADIDALKELKAGWNGYDVAAPKIEAIHDATEWIEQMYEDVMRSRLAWRKPHVAADENGDVTFEWWNGDQGLTIYVSADGSVSYLKDWGLDIVDDMEGGPLSTPEERRKLWAWFVR